MCVKDLIFHKLMFYLQLQDPKKWLDDAEIVKFPYNIFSGITYINKGASGQVYRAKWKSDMDVALKEIMKKTKKDDGEVMKQFVHEFRSHNQVDGHENILNIYGITQNPKSGNYSLVLQFANHGTLHEYLSANVDKLDWTKKLGLAYQLASGIQALHSKGIIHRDLHAGNVLIVDDNIKISDFGLSKSREKVYGKIRYTDPRCLEHPKNEKSDIFSLGILLWQISSCKPPYEWIENDQDVYLSGERETKVDGTPEEYFDLCTRCWDSDPDNRPDIKSVVEYLDKLREQHYTVPTIIQKSTNEHLQNASTDCNHSSGAYHDFKFNDLMNEQDLLMKQNMGNTSNSDQYISDSNTNNNNNNDDIINIFNVNSFDNSSNADTYYNSSLHSITMIDPSPPKDNNWSDNLTELMVIYEQPAYFGNSEFFEVGASETTTQTKAIMIGSVMVPDGFRGVVWQSSNFSGTNLGLFEPVANFTGVSVATNQAPAGSFDISSASCTNECGSGGFCNEKKTCVCKNGFTGEKCDQCLPGFFGPNCQACQTSCGDPTKFTCEDGLSGSGACKCKDGFTGEKCDQCLPGFFGTNCQACNCGNGTCDDKGACSCNAGWANDPNDPKKLCSTCDIGFFASGEDCKVCSSGCNSCEAQTGKCTVCKPSLALSTDDATKCVPAANSCTAGQYFDSASQLCQPCNTQCQTCYGPGPGDCLKCLPPLSYFNGGCLPQKPTNDGKCQLNVATQQAFFIDNSQGACEACPSSCTDCSIQGYTPQSPKESMTCSKCMPGFVLDNGKCVKTCSSNKFADKDMTCKDCNSACKSCSGPLENQCLSCSNSANFAINGVCSPTPCPSSYVSLNTTCTKCHPDCAECSGPGINQCTKCPSNRPVLTKDGQCIEVCPMGTYLDSTGKCQQCNKKCSSCVGPDADQCLGCSNQSNVLIDGSCNSSCPPGTKLIKSERLCQNEENNQLVPPQPAANSEFKQIDIDVDGSIGNYNATTSQIFNTPPPYDSKAGEMYWKNNEYVLKRAPPTTGQTVANDVYYNGGSSGTNESNSENWNGKIDRKSSNWGDNWI
ncbi:7785_t:CDS:10 [Entrophospora sp. SA101]|nr:1467_t:CDS:10 [Entrophospora sp. SA101]CAJ0763995.1 7785_t:CDS:10 [Entrophospora sp. SA101]